MLKHCTFICGARGCHIKLAYAVGQCCATDIRHFHVKEVIISRLCGILGTDIRQPKHIVAASAADSADLLPAVYNNVPPMQYVALLELHGGAAQQVSAGKLRLGFEEREAILKLIAETVSAGALIKARTPKKSADLDLRIKERICK